MLYRHNLRFQRLLQKALNLQMVSNLMIDGKEVRYTHDALIRHLQLSFKKSKLSGFARASFPSPAKADIVDHDLRDFEKAIQRKSDAIKLWDHLDSHSFIKTALSDSDGGFRKKHLTEVREVANAISSYFDAHEGQISDFVKDGITRQSTNLENNDPGDWICFRRSQRNPEYIVKSKWNFETDDTGEFFSVRDQQYSSGRYEAMGDPVHDDSTGFAISKTNKLWCFLREVETDQPRVFCFFRFLKGEVQKLDTFRTEEIKAIFGHVIETSKKFDKSRFYSQYVVLISPGLDQRYFETAYLENTYNISNQLDMFHAENDKKPPVCASIPAFVEKYLNSGEIQSII